MSPIVLFLYIPLSSTLVFPIIHRVPALGGPLTTCHEFATTLTGGSGLKPENSGREIHLGAKAQSD